VPPTRCLSPKAGLLRPATPSRKKTPSTEHAGGAASRVIPALHRSRQLGFLGPGPVEAHIDHAEALAQAAARQFDPTGGGLVLDLGTGGGVPGLVLAGLWPDCRFVLLDANRRRTSFLAEVVRDLDWSDRVGVVCERAEVAGRDAGLRAAADLVVARSFAPPAVTAECAAPFLNVGGVLVVADPPATDPPATDPPATAPSAVPDVSGRATNASDEFRDETHAVDDLNKPRWPATELAQLGLVPVELVSTPVAVQLLRQATLCPPRFPRRTGVPSRRPLF
jgi:16S rRNA (guanine527-N7)-methyltransferase